MKKKILKITGFIYYINDTLVKLNILFFFKINYAHNLHSKIMTAIKKINNLNFFFLFKL